MAPEPLAPDRLVTDRLILRRWTDADREPFAALNADPVVMEHFPVTLSRADSDAFVDRITGHLDQHGFGLWAVEVRSTAEFAGFVGLWTVGFEAPFAPAVEVGWRLAHRFWGAGLAPEAARAAVADGFDRVGLTDIVSFTAATNLNSQRVMAKIGMTRVPDGDFDHPALPEGHRLRPHVLYRLTR